MDAAVTVDDTFVEVDEDGVFEAPLRLGVSAVVVEIVASIATGEEKGAVLIVAYEPPAE